MDKTISWAEAEFWTRVGMILNFKLFEIDGNGISLGKLISGILLLVVGYLISRRASKEIGKRVLARMPVEDSIRYTLQQLVFYFFLFLTTLFTLRALNVPITIFTVIGGALAVGIGFGSQNLVNNFISGLLVMAERPMRVGDIIEIDGVTGVVETIGIRSTRVRTLQNVLVIMPNTNFIEKNLTNWTMSEIIYSKIRIGVAYGTDTDKLQRLCLQAAGEIPQILTSPPPDLTFADFGDSALLFDLGFCLHMSSIPARKTIESSIRYRLNALFNQNGIDVPFPIRDVRLTVQGKSDLQIRN